MGVIIGILACWCLFNSIEIRINAKGDRRADVLDKMTNDILDLQDKRIDKLEDFTKETVNVLNTHNKAIERITKTIIKMNKDEE